MEPGSVMASNRSEQAGPTVDKNFKVKEVADILSISQQSVYQLCACKKLTHLRLGVGRGTLRIPASALAAFVESTTVQMDRPTEPLRSEARLKHLKL